MKYSALNSFPILALLGGRLTKVQRRKEVQKRSYLPDCSLSFHLEMMQESSWDLCSVGDGLPLEDKKQGLGEPASG